MPSLSNLKFLMPLLALGTFAAPAIKRQSIPTDGDYSFGCSIVNNGITIVLPGDGSDDTSGYDAAGNCGGGVLDNLHGQAIIVDNWGCSYTGTNTAIMQFKSGADFSTGSIVAAINAATGQQMPDSVCSSNLLDYPSVSNKAKRGGPLPSDGSLTFSCVSWTNSPVDEYIIILPGDGTETTSGFDAAGSCGKSVLDNMHGQALSPTSWGCAYVGSSTANITFTLELDGQSQVGDAINAATGSQEASCTWSESDPDSVDPAVLGEAGQSPGFVDGDK